MDEDVRLPHLVGRYALLGKLASGGMGTVYLARLQGDLGFGRIVAVKRLHPRMASDPRFQANFLNEGKLAARIRHPNVVGTIDVVASNGELALVMEYVECVTLAGVFRKLRARDESVPIPIAAAILGQVLSGLHAAHETRDEDGRPLGIVHRDVSGQNVLVGTDGVARVADFGVAQAKGDVTRDVMGKLGYMAPEELSSEPIDRRTDVWAAGVLLWEAVTGRRLFFAEPGEVIRRILTHDILPPSRFAATLAPELEAVILRALARSPLHRFRSALEMATELERAVPRLVTAREIATWLRDVAGDEIGASLRRIRALEHQARALATPAPPPPRAAWTDASTLDATWTKTTTIRPPPRRGRRAVLLGAAASVAACALVFAGLAARPRPRAATAPGPKPVEEMPAPAPSQTTAPSVEAAPPPTGTSAPPRAPIHPRRTSCSPPWRLDPEGIRIPKPECM